MAYGSVVRADKHIFVDSGKYGFTFNGCKQNGNEETEYYCFNWDKYFTAPVKKTNINKVAKGKNKKVTNILSYP